MTRPSSNVAATASGRKPNWLLALARKWHTWGGLAAALFLIVVGVSGIVLNYKQPVFAFLGIDHGNQKQANATKPVEKSPAVELTLANAAALPVSLAQALGFAREQWGDARLERIELKTERAQTQYRIRKAGGDELWVDASTGARFVKGAYQRAARGNAAAMQTDWGKVLIDLHTGKIGGAAGKAMMSIAAAGLVFLSLSGVYMWLKPLLLRRRNAKTASARAQAVPGQANAGAVAGPQMARVGAK